MADAPLPIALDFSKNPSASPSRMNVAMTAIDARFRVLEAQRASLDAEIAELQAIGLSRITDSLEPMFAIEQSRIASGVLIASSETTAVVALGTALRFQVDAAQWTSFSPSTFVALTRTSTPDWRAVLQTASYDPKSGLYTGSPLAVVGDPGPFSDWQLSSTAGSVVAVMDALTAALAARDTVAATAVTVAAQAATVTALSDRITISPLPPTGGQDGDLWFQY